MISSHSNIETGADFSSGRLMIETSVLQVIHDWICLSIDEVGFDIYVRELAKGVVEDVRR